MSLSSTEEIIEEIRQGRMVVIMDDEDRENEGDLLIAASCVRPEDINFMARHGRGLICLTLTRERCQKLNLPLMVRDTYYNYGTNFTVSIEAATGVSTGISAADRARTVQAAVAPNAKPSDLVQPGHVFPLMSQPGGVLVRAGHTEAGCDLARLAGFEPAAVIVEILNEDGSMARRPELEELAAEHGLKVGTIADLIRFRIHNEKTVERVAEADVQTEFGEMRLITFRDSVEHELHLALVKGSIAAEDPVPVRVHVENPLFDLTGCARPESGWALRDAMLRLGREPCGVVVILRNQYDAGGLLHTIERWNAPADALPEPPARSGKDELRTIGLGAQILADVGVRKMRVMSRHRKLSALSGFGLEVVEYITH
ncbi:MAG: bifunctional 3,4-dihydroxy-2-butanone-4-phosphate synthase/GTP cyclohydrolase II [Chromatiales bacterium]